VTEVLKLRPARPTELDTLRAIDDESGPMYAAAGVDLSCFDFSHPFVQDEQTRWIRALADGRAHVATLAGEVVGFSVLDTLDGAPYLDQLSVRTAFMRRGIGTSLLSHALRVSEAAGALWLTTYAHLAWNAPYYERAGFRLVADEACGADIREVLQKQRAVMPAPELRIAMMHRFG
jgi:GNAT superfamily N-acetyltransferase